MYLGFAPNGNAGRQGPFSPPAVSAGHRKGIGVASDEKGLLSGSQDVTMKFTRRGLVILAALVLLLPIATFYQSKSEAEGKAGKHSGSTKLRIQVTAGEKDHPVENASVYVKYVQERTLAKAKKIEMNVKTNRDGIAKVPDIPRGTVLIQVIAEGWKTFGRWYDLESEEQTVKIHLEKPPRWY